MLKAVIRWVDGEHDEEGGWSFHDDGALTPLGAAAFYAWDQWRRHGVLPYAGGWAEQPLSLLVQVEAIDVTFNQWRLLRSEKGGFKALSAVGRQLVREFERGE